MKIPTTIIASNPIDALKEVIRGEEVAKGGDVERDGSLTKTLLLWIFMRDLNMGHNSIWIIQRIFMDKNLRKNKWNEWTGKYFQFVFGF